MLGVPVPTEHLQGLDSLLSIVQMPAGIPVATFAIGDAGAPTPPCSRWRMLALGDAALAARLETSARAPDRAGCSTCTCREPS